MRVICINVNRTNDQDVPNLPHPELGETVTVIGSDEKYDEHFYHLKEYAEYRGVKVWYNAKSFVPVSDIDETALVTLLFKEGRNVNS